jgi:hypothetical protein
MPDTPQPLSVARLRDGTITIHKGRPPSLWGNLGRGFSVPLGVALGCGVLLWQLAPTVGWHVRAWDAFDVSVVLAGLGIGAVRLWHHRHQPDRIELDWRREEVRLYARAGTTFIPFAELGTVAVASQWVEDAVNPLSFQVLAEAGHEKLLLGQFDSEGAAREWAAELNALLGH